MTNNGFSYVFKEAKLSTSTTDLEHNKYVGQISTIMKAVSSRDGDLLSQFDNIDEKLGADEHATTTIIQDTSLHKMLIANHENDPNRGKIKGQLPLEHIFGFCRTFKKVTKNLGFHFISRLKQLIYKILFIRLYQKLHQLMS